MRAVNLLPEKHRPRKATGGQRGSSYILLGVLGAVVIAVLVYVVTVNSINEAKTDVADAKAETVRANAQAGQLGAYGDFAKVKTERVATVKRLAQSRMDWERLVRELAVVLPDGVWIQNASAADGSGAQSSTGSTASSSSSSSTSAPAGGGTLTLTGCAENQGQVADTLVRLRELQGASDVKLDHSSTQNKTGSAPSSGSASGTADCGSTHGKTNYDFQVAVTFDAPKPEPYKPGNVPARLGGGQ
jgi:Tfp pilus assembly protein PilN